MNELTTISDSDSEPIVEEEQTGINTALLLQVADHIEHHAEQFDMKQWRGAQTKKLPNPWYRSMAGLPAPTERCGTTYCIAGWTVKLGGGDMDSNLPAQAQRLLGLSLDQAERLFYEAFWPYRFQNRNVAVVNRAWYATERIRHFIATNGAE